jgi:hypothetical protein
MPGQTAPAWASALRQRQFEDRTAGNRSAGPVLGGPSEWVRFTSGPGVNAAELSQFGNIVI